MQKKDYMHKFMNVLHLVNISRSWQTHIFAMFQFFNSVIFRCDSLREEASCLHILIISFIISLKANKGTILNKM